jgi:hypothetical protein
MRLVAIPFLTRVLHKQGWPAVAQANSSAPASVNFTDVPLSCITSQPFGDGEIKPGLIFGRCARELK